MKKLFISTLAVVPVYLLGAFANAGFDITMWSDFARMIVAMFMAVAVLFALGALSGI